ncbi:hypothetical protein Tsubulata_017226 [Turnera subulata]|uniref:CRAL/TRIO N-terminal domain-containing protein n=1 Tax=Turnera subulata TaxID=218843 RepID=A0A9Q0GJ13_9ROSI|nr:hypothetical protein Tsubulata_017226 [Turnera subulata]
MIFSQITGYFPSLQINEVRKILGPSADKLPVLCSDASIFRYLRARSWNTKKAAKMLKETLRWRLGFKPEMIRWLNCAGILVSLSVMEELFDLEKLESSTFGGRNSAGFDYQKYGQRMREDDQKMSNVISLGYGSAIPTVGSELKRLGSMTSDDIASEESDSSIGEETSNLNSIHKKTQGLSLGHKDASFSKAAELAKETGTK